MYKLIHNVQEPLKVELSSTVAYLSRQIDLDLFVLVQSVVSNTCEFCLLDLLYFEFA